MLTVPGEGMLIPADVAEPSPPGTLEEPTEAPLDSTESLCGSLWSLMEAASPREA